MTEVEGVQSTAILKDQIKTLFKPTLCSSVIFSALAIFLVDISFSVNCTHYNRHVSLQQGCV